MAAEMLSPFVYWGQNNEYIFLKVDLKDAENTEVNLTDDDLAFSASGVGGRGRNNYSFSIDFYFPIDAEKSKYRVTERNIEFQVLKAACGEVWPRLTVSQKKPEWLKIDFDKFVTEDDSEDEAKKQEEDADKARAEEEMWKRLDQDLKKTHDEATSDLKSMWLFVYNLFQWVGYTYIFAILCWKYFKEGPESKGFAMETVGTQLMVCQLVSMLEIVHPLAGLVKTGVSSPLMQVCGRNFVLFMVILPEEHLHSSEWVWWLFVVWTSIEIIRYPFYMLSSINRELYVITWLRYTLWIPIYPLGFVVESLVLLQAVPLYEISGKWSLELPNFYNMAFYFPYFVRIYLAVFLFGGYLLLKHMYVQRRKRLSPSKTKTS